MESLSEERRILLLDRLRRHSRRMLWAWAAVTGGFWLGGAWLFDPTTFRLVGPVVGASGLLAAWMILRNNEAVAHVTAAPFEMERRSLRAVTLRDPDGDRSGVIPVSVAEDAGWVEEG